MAAAEEVRWRTTWKAGYTRDALYFGFCCQEPDLAGVRDDAVDQRMSHFWNQDCVGVALEPRRMWPAIGFLANARGSRWSMVGYQPHSDYRWQAAAQREAGCWSVVLRIPFVCLGRKPGEPLRFNVSRIIPQPQKGKGEIVHRWVACQPLPQSRLIFDADNPADLGWLTFVANPSLLNGGDRKGIRCNKNMKSK